MPAVEPPRFQEIGFFWEGLSWQQHVGPESMTPEAQCISAQPFPDLHQDSHLLSTCSHNHSSTQWPHFTYTYIRPGPGPECPV